jgi:hypothetical protein
MSVLKMLITRVGLLFARLFAHADSKLFHSVPFCAAVKQPNSLKRQ